ncbi:hypothetical protein C4K04_3460 [Pseudomonas chlororaphis]|uniref:Uncharacterized protein n=1 Tax=Pseudomonas chlororaphis TaxID=587753 RepID=A0A3G7TRT1_9PSED|nr:hypothetical protein [Pseudomonas chlororaphis]AZE49132.1 hypothetical protein C4K04_3460 [Pseudomonas chlororaphis]
MNQEHGRSMIFSSLFNDDFLARPFVRQTVMCPWFYLQAEVREGKEFVGEMLMVSSFDSLKDILEQQHDSFRVRSIQYVTPGVVNKTGHWCMEPLLEASEAVGQSGEKIPILTVAGRTYSQMDISTEIDFTNVKVLFTHETDRHD